MRETLSTIASELGEHAQALATFTGAVAWIVATWALVPEQKLPLQCYCTPDLVIVTMFAAVAIGVAVGSITYLVLSKLD